MFPAWARRGGQAAQRLCSDHSDGDLKKTAGPWVTGAVGGDVGGVYSGGETTRVNSHQELSSGEHEVQVLGVGHPGGGAGQHELNIEGLLVLGRPLVIVQEQRLHFDSDLLTLLRSCAS